MIKENNGYGGVSQNIEPGVTANNGQEGSSQRKDSGPNKCWSFLLLQPNEWTFVRNLSFNYGQIKIVFEKDSHFNNESKAIHYCYFFYH